MTAGLFGFSLRVGRRTLSQNCWITAYLDNYNMLVVHAVTILSTAYSVSQRANRDKSLFLWKELMEVVGSV